MCALQIKGENENLNKKLAASLTIAIFLISTFAILAPVQAHFTLGENVPNYPYTIQNFDPHVGGVVGYVWPGGGEAAYAGSYTGVSNVVGPGYVAPYPTPSLTKAGVYPSPWTQNYAQLDGHEYAPFGAIVTGSTGDLIFAINYTGTGAVPPAQVFDSFFIAIPPEFNITGTEQVVTTITNNYGNINIYKANAFDRYVPGWTLIKISADRQALINFAKGQWYYVRINGVTAPKVAGKYFFKMYLYYSAPSGTFTTCGELCQPRVQYWVPTQNWPVLLVKGELDPAIITGTIMYGGYNSSLYGTPIKEAGMVKAVMKTKLDPYTGQQLSGPLTNAQAYFNGTVTNSTGTYGANGHFELEGVAPGIYDLYAEAAGYPLSLIGTNVQVAKGQSLHFDGYLNPGPVIHGDVFSKHSFGSEPWPENTYIKIELYNAPTVNHVPTSNSTLVSWSPIPCIAGGQDKYYPGNDAGTGVMNGQTPGMATPYEGCGNPRTVAGGIAFPWHEWDGNQGPNTGAGGTYRSFSTPYSTDPQGVGPPQTWYVVADGVNDKFHYEFGAKGMFGAPKDLDGHVPQRFATWVNGLTAGRYYARAWVFRYVQSALDGSTFQEYSFQVTSNEWAGDVSIPIDLRISSWINKTVHFHDEAGTLSTSPISTGARYIAGGLYDANNVLWSYNVTTTGVGMISSTATASNPTLGYRTNALDHTGVNAACAVTGDCNIQFWGFNDTWIGENYGIPAGTYTPKVYALGYIQQTFDKVSITLSGTPIQISNHLYRGAGFNFTVYSIDWERPRVNRNWVWPGNDVAIGIYDSKLTWVTTACYVCYSGRSGLWSASVQNHTYWVEPNGTGSSLWGAQAHGVWFGLEVGSGTTLYAKYGGQMSTQARTFTTGTAKNTWQLSFYFPTAIDSGQYSFQGWTYGYIQDKDYTVYVNKGQIADMKINLLIGVNITLDILFKTEHLIAGTPNNMSARVRFFDDSGSLVAEWMSSEGTYAGRNFGLASGQAVAADGTALYPFDGGENQLNGGTTLLHVSTSGLPMAPEALYGPKVPVYNYGLLGTTSLTSCPAYSGIACLTSASNNGTNRGTTYGDPVFTPNGGNFKMSTWPSDYWSVPKAHFPNEGILGSPDYTGTGWTAEVDFVNWYLNNSASLVQPSIGVPNYNPTGAQWYPPVPGLLMGESFHIIPGTAAKSKISFTEDGALDPYYFVTLGKEKTAHSMAPNHLGPYSQQGVWTIGPAPLSGETSAIWEVDLNGYVSGTALAFTWSNEFRSISWYTVTIVGASGNVTFNSYTMDGVYEFYLVPGQYSMSISGPGYKSTPLGTISVTSGQGGSPGSGSNIGLPQSNIPVPEFSGIAVVALSALAASLYLLRRRRQ
jgi:hypothetical protein